MDKDQLQKAIDEVQREFYDNSHWEQSYYAQFLETANQERYDDYFLFAAVVRDALIDSYSVVSAWEKGVDRPAVLEEASRGEMERVARELGEQGGVAVAKYLGLGYRRGASRVNVSDKKEADEFYEELLFQRQSDEEALLRSNYELRELHDRIVGVAMTSTAHWLAHHNKGLSWETVCGGFCYGIVTACSQAWMFGGRVAEMVLISNDLSALDFDPEGEPDGQETEEKGQADG